METLLVIATCMIAVFTVALFALQYSQHRHDKKIANANYKMALFDKRMQFYYAIEEFFKEFWREGGPPIEAAVKLRFEARTAHFLFPKEPIKFIEELVQKSFEHQNAKIRWEPIRKKAWEGEELSAEETAQKEKLLNEMRAVERWFHQQTEEGRLQAEFEPFLVLPDTL